MYSFRFAFTVLLCSWRAECSRRVYHDEKLRPPRARRDCSPIGVRKRDLIREQTVVKAGFTSTVMYTTNRGLALTHGGVNPIYYEQALFCLSNREIVDASRGCTFHCKMANNRFFLL